MGDANVVRDVVADDHAVAGQFPEASALGRIEVGRDHLLRPLYESRERPIGRIGDGAERLVQCVALIIVEPDISGIELTAHRVSPSRHPPH
jgi:hypothetical protein